MLLPLHLETVFLYKGEVLAVIPGYMLYGFKSYMDLKAINSEIGLENEGDMDLQGARTFFLR